MNLSRNWLDEFVHFTATDHEFAEAMTMSGSKVETTERLDAEIKNVVVGKVLDMKRHENSDHMWVCQIDTGDGEPVQIVTGAQNVRVGDLVPVARHNSWLPGGVHITKGKLRGETSCGMLCSIKELNLTLHDVPYAVEDGIWILQEDCTVGQDINEVIGNNDAVVEFEITNNRPDCFSLIGLAREAAATFGAPLLLHEPQVRGGAKGSLAELLDVDIQAADLCPRYSARMVRNVKIGPSPKWMRQRLRACGVRPINNIVDITNYVMLEYGQPMHAFDYRYVSGGKIVVRRAEPGEALTTLDGAVRNLQPGMLVIADEHKPVGLAGIMGGENSEIVADTVDVVFESANFDGVSIRQTALALGMRTDASAKFEKGLDPMNTVPAVNRACELVEMLGAGEVLDGTIDVINHVEPLYQLPLEPERINALLGIELSTEQMKAYLLPLGFTFEGDLVTVPSWRPDVRCMADLAEEVGRFYGYDKLPTTMFSGAAMRGGYTPAQRQARQIEQAARSLGFSEIITYSFISPSAYDLIRRPADDPLRRNIRIINPLGEDTSVMRATAVPCMLDVLARNWANRNKAARLYELATVYLPVEGQALPNEPKHFMLGMYGAGESFFTLKGAVEEIFSVMHTHPADYTAETANPTFHPGRCATITIDGTVIGTIGQIHPLAAANYGIDTEVYLADLDFTALQVHLAPEATYQPLPRFPTVSRDIAVVCDESISVGTLENAIRAAGGPILRGITLFDVYRGVHIPEGKKSVAFSLELRADDRTLTDADSEAEVKTVLAALEQNLGATLR